MQLVVNADDAGLARSTDDAILRCAAEGVVRSASVVAGGATAEEFLRRAADAGLAVGLHVNLTQGRALAGPAPTLTDAAGSFCGSKSEFWARGDALDDGEVRAELAAQWAWLADRGARLTHIDGHNHVHVLPAVRRALDAFDAALWVRAPAAGCTPGLPEPVARWAREFAGPWRTVERFAGYRFCLDPAADVFLDDLSGTVVEFMVHPGARPGSPFVSSPRRDAETEVLCSAALRDELARRKVRLTSFGELA